LRNPASASKSRNRACSGSSAGGSGSEVDFVVYGRGGFCAIEVKNARRVQSADLRGLRAFRDDYPTARLGLVYRGTERLLVEGVPCVPAAEFLAGVRPAQRLPLCPI
jgi:predicted AAA+ superfamily ATPase